VEVKELDYVETRSGRKGTIVHVYKDGAAYEIEYDGSAGHTDTITPEEIVKVIV